MEPGRPRTAPLVTHVALAVLTAGVLVACGPATRDDPDTTARDGEIAALESQVADLEAEVERLRAAEAPAPEGPAERPASPRTEEGLVEQLHAFFRSDAERDMGFQPAPTPWEPATVPDGFGEGDAAFGSAGALMTALAAELAGDQLGGDAWEAATRVLFDNAEGDPDADEATGAVLLWGFLDDSVAGSDHRISLRRGADGWFADAAEQRSRCRRGVVDGGLCV